jgi:hypothetical protein
MPSCSTSFSIRRRHPEQVADRDHADHRLLRAFAALQQPLGEVRATAKLRQRQLDRADPGVPLPGPVAVAGVDPLLAAGAVLGATSRVRLGAHQRLHEHPEQLAQQVRLGLLKVLVDQLGRVNTVGVDRHREFPFLKVDLLGLLEDHAVAVVYGLTAR